MSGRERRDNVTSTNSDGATPVTAQCPPGKRVLGGGARIEGSGLSNSFAIVETWPDSDGVSWNARAVEVVTSPENWSLRAYAICATVS